MFFLNPNITTVAKDPASVFRVYPDEEIAKHSAMILDNFEIASEERGERLIMCMTLTECGHRGEGGDVPAGRGAETVTMQVTAPFLIQGLATHTSIYIVCAHAVQYISSVHAPK